jgi:hypothetical protein
VESFHQVQRLQGSVKLLLADRNAAEKLEFRLTKLE